MGEKNIRARVSGYLYIDTKGMDNFFIFESVNK